MISGTGTYRTIFENWRVHQSSICLMICTVLSICLMICTVLSENTDTAQE
jgi:hypothetical protein